MIEIFKKDTKGKIRYLKTWTEGSVHLQESGVVGTDKPVTHKTTCKIKNEGRSNETTPEVQAISEMESLVAQKIKEGYFYTQKEAEEGNVILPMLAKSYKDEVKKIDWNTAYVQPKLDGMRCLATLQDGKVTLMSREGTEITTVPHIIKDLKRIKANVVLDGELWVSGSFQENMRLIKKYRQGETEKVNYNMYDLVSDKPFAERYELLKNLLKSLED